MVPKIKDINPAIKQPDKLLTINENSLVADAAQKMTDNHIGCLVVLDANSKFAGIISERDMLARVLTTSLSPDKVLVKDIMTSEVVSCTLDTSIAKAEQLMAKHKIRHVPIVENDIPIGMLSTRDLIAYRLRSNQAMKVAAENLAILSAKLKSPDFDDVIKLVTEEVPKTFEAKWGLVYFPSNDLSPPILHNKGCPALKENLPDPRTIEEIHQNGWAICGKIWKKCQKSRAHPPRLTIPLSIAKQSSDPDDTSQIRQGFLCMCRFNPSTAESEELQIYKASLLQEVLNANLTNAKLYQSYRKAERDSQTDPLTGVGTRRVLDKLLDAEHARAIRYNTTFSVAIVDIDNLKEINDTHGHPAGDKALQKLAKIMRHNMRSVDAITRYGGDEFVVLMPETKLDKATGLLERLRNQIRDTTSTEHIPITISCGAAEWSRSTSDSARATLIQADIALYEAKRKGRNCVVTNCSAVTTSAPAQT